MAAEIFRDHDVGGLLRPRLRNLDVALFKDNGTLLVADDRIAHFPFDLVERINTCGGKEPRKFQAGGGLCLPCTRGFRRLSVARRRTHRLSCGCRRQTLLGGALLHASSSDRRHSSPWGNRPINLLTRQIWRIRAAWLCR